MKERKPTATKMENTFYSFRGDLIEPRKESVNLEQKLSKLKNKKKGKSIWELHTILHCNI